MFGCKERTDGMQQDVTYNKIGILTMAARKIEALKRLGYYSIREQWIKVEQKWASRKWKTESGFCGVEDETIPWIWILEVVQKGNGRGSVKGFRNRIVKSRNTYASEWKRI